MKGFIEVTELNDEHKKQALNIIDIIRFYSYNDYTTIITKELVSRYECSNDNFYLSVKESYEQIKELIKQAQ